MEVSALRYSGGIALHGRSPLLRLQSDERLISLIRRGNGAAFEVLVSRYQSRLLAFCRHLLGSKEDAEDVLQEVMAAAFNAILADQRPINVRPWLYRIARNRSLNHLRRIQAIGVDSMDIHFSENGASTADKVHDREQFRLLVGDIQNLPETQRTALVLREMDALSYEQIAEAMDTTVPGVKSLLVRARISLAEAAEARQLSCDEVRIELAEVAEGLRKRPTPLVRRHIRGCRRCANFQSQLKQTNRALAALLPIGPVALLRQLLVTHIGHSAGTGSGATAAGATGATGAGATGVAASQMAAAAGTAGGGTAFGSVGGLISAGAGAVATKAAAGLAAAALVTAGAVEASHVTPRQHSASAVVVERPSGGVSAADQSVAPVVHAPANAAHAALRAHHKAKAKSKASTKAHTVTRATPSEATTNPLLKKKRDRKHKTKKELGRTDTQTSPTVLSSSQTPSSTSPSTNTAPDTTTSAASAPSSTQPSSDPAPTGTTGPSGTTTPPVAPSSSGTAPAADTTTTTTPSDPSATPSTADPAPCSTGATGC
jgi:RNA polymerase sigma factor (sigma-70 family)